MADENGNSADAGTAEMSVDEGANVIASLLGPLDEGTAQIEGEAVDTSAPDTSEKALDDEATRSESETPDENVEEEPRYRLSDGTEATLSEIEEWRKGNLRQSDYTRKTMELAANRKELEARLSEITQQSSKYQEHVDFAISVAQANLPAQPDVSMLNIDPVGYMQQKAHYEERLGQLQRLYAAKQEHENAQSVQRQSAYQQWVESERTALVEAMPELRDPAKATEFTNDLSRAIERYGFDAKQDLPKVADHRLILLARDAMAYQKLMASKPKAIEKAKDAPPVQQPGKRPSQSESAARATKEKLERLRKTGTLERGDPLIHQLLGG